MSALQEQFRRQGIPTWMRLGDEVAFLIVALILIGGMFNSGYVLLWGGRTLAFLGCALLGAWAVVGWFAGRWKHDGLVASLWIILFFALAIVWSRLLLIPFPRGFVTAISPIWREWVAAAEGSGLDVPTHLTLALSPEKGLHSWNQLVASGLFFSGVCLLAQRGAMALRLAYLVGILCIFAGWWGLWRYVGEGVARAYGAVYNPNHHGAMVLMGVPVMLMLLTRLHRFRKMDGRGDLLGGSDPTLVFMGLVMAAAIGGLVSGSRGVLLFGGGMLFVWFVLEFIGNRLSEAREGRGLSEFQPRHVIIPAAVVAVVGFFALAMDNFLARFDGSEIDRGRLGLSIATLQGLYETNFIGLGLSGAEPMINRHFDQGTSAVPIWTHNDHVQFFSELGLIGSVLCGLALFGFLRHCWRLSAYRSAAFTWKQRSVQRGALAGVVLVLVHAVSDFHLRIPLIGFLFLTLLALAINNGLLFAYGGSRLHGRSRGREDDRDEAGYV